MQTETTSKITNEQKDYTANVCRDLQGLCGDIGVPGFQIYGDACIPAIPVSFEVNQKKWGLFIYTL